jgi:hypothetical protein
MKFTYSSGSRPLDGYTIKRGIGNGGFGEVYYAVSDGGKEVALKLVRSNLEVELRGMAMCLNLKHPNLVALYDIKKDAHGNTWVVMEYVSGESLATILNRHPRGLALDLVRQWFLSLAKAVGHLHDNGIVHRDLKPGNIFIENGIVKVGDYGLSKFISASHRSAHTQSVGTVHYMAPEIATGNYGKQIDVYAAGIILYEMITGKVPFDGETSGEVLMKHMTALPDLSKLPPGYATVVGRALAKDPAHRYRSMGEMARAVEQLGAAPQPPSVIPAGGPPLKVQPVEPPVLAEVVGPTLRGKVAELATSLVAAAILAALFTMIWAALDRRRDLAEFGATFYLTLLTSWAVLVPAKLWDQRRGDPWLRRGLMLVLGLGVGVAAAWLNGWDFTAAPVTAEEPTSSAPLWPEEMTGSAVLSSRLFGYTSYFAVAFFLMRWWKLAERNRPRRFALFPVVLAGVLAVLLGMLFWPDFRQQGLVAAFLMQGPVALTLTAVIVQVVSPWVEPAPRPLRRVRLRYA